MYVRSGSMLPSNSIWVGVSGREPGRAHNVVGCGFGPAASALRHREQIVVELAQCR